ncbi:GNAT family N-acetyltransferase [Vibrio sp. 10N.286.49.C2]|uniref:GNAT family N-acetyltransferase n=1 Tax=unclassified Vibrio TaxID=2614977 RepID=UPI000C859A76|nr:MULTISPECIES: GNAT family N-acetyltransferase [unclassified Vibrio]PMH26371.1 GNAT family N-acetyltransferase [Vibrio sp. 10N.286.49.C2]PMH54905.1 GNAT family N-acetyltransferase [Vibrio sp. 10N.286.49.B1]PMH81141.1 GNAT family N-acetyltransferase [Vibrio sp. 10N.286.48.B7]
MKMSIVKVEAQYDAKLCDVIKSVGLEYGAVGEGFGPSDPEVECMSQHYTQHNRSLYLVALLDGKVVGGCGLAPFGVDDNTCELKKLFLLKETRGLGLGKRLANACLEYAQQAGFKRCYLDTLSNMTSAVRLYENLGFEHLPQPLEGTLHNGCDVWMLKSL